MARGDARAVLAVREFRGLEVSAVISTVGDQLARVALSVLVYARTGSAALTAVTYAVSFLPAIVGGPLLAGLADRLPRRDVMVACDLGRAALIGLTAIPGAPLVLLLVLLFGVGLLDSPFIGARSGVVRAAVGNELYSQASSLDQALNQTAQLVGFGVAGLAVAATSPRVALLGDTASFLVSAAALLLLVQRRAAAQARVDGPRPGLLSLAGVDAALGWHALMGSRLSRRAVLLAWIGAAALIAPEGVAAPWAAHLDAGPRAVGLLLLASPLGTVLGVLVAGAERGGAREDPSRAMFALLAAAFVPLIACFADPPLAVSVGLLAVSGFGGGFIVLAQVLVVRRTPDHQLGRAIAVAGSGLTVAKAVALVTGGLAAQIADAAAPTVVAGLGLLAAAGCVGVAVGTREAPTVAGKPRIL